jgi:hypothetical protein
MAYLQAVNGRLLGHRLYERFLNIASYMCPGMPSVNRRLWVSLGTYGWIMLIVSMFVVMPHAPVYMSVLGF